MTQFFADNIVVIYFFYGLAFFSMGLLVWIESGRNSEFRIARSMGLLAGFGIVHGLHEWFEMFQILGRSGATSLPPWLLLDELRLAHLVISFVFLVLFGVRLIYHSRRNAIQSERTLAYVAAGALLLVWLASILVTRALYAPDHDAFLTMADVLARYILGIPGALLAAWAIVLEQRTFRERGMPDFGRSLLWAAQALALYGVVGQIFTQQSVLFPSNIINAGLFFDLFGLPVQLFRATAATLMAIFIMRALRAFEVESQQRLNEANEARLAAQQEALETQRQAHEETAQLNAELQTAVRDLSLLVDLSRSLATTLDRDALFEKALHKIVGAMPRVQAGLILWRERPDRPLQPAAQVGCNGDCADVAHVVGRQVVEEEQAIVADSAIGAPLTVQEQVVGSLVVSAGDGSPPFSEQDLSLISAVAGQLSLAAQNATLYQAVQTRDELRGELLQQIVDAQERERQRIARELHDSTGQILTGLGLGLAAALQSVGHNPEVASRQLTELKQLNSQALEELRAVIGDLRPSVLDDMGLVAALQSQVQAFEARTDAEARLEVSGRRRRLRPDAETVVFRIAQEALTNVAKHAEAVHVAVQLHFDEAALTLTVEDDGRGFDPDESLAAEPSRRRAWGLLGMQERAALVGGTFQVRSRPGKGTTIEVTVPLMEEGSQ